MKWDDVWYNGLIVYERTEEKTAYISPSTPRSSRDPIDSSPSSPVSQSSRLNSNGISSPEHLDDTNTELPTRNMSKSSFTIYDIYTCVQSLQKDYETALKILNELNQSNKKKQMMMKNGQMR
ncbi:unnamed protein product [Brachionus calyciflorus]|uniref:Uncharacterized protein n=1 Tax=Brachionus calyciflorus TaxID=104777 RepID=A0A814E836_9BILA|nr:unnamed protein product [Brachionus calyciflorus]